MSMARLNCHIQEQAVVVHNLLFNDNQFQIKNVIITNYSKIETCRVDLGHLKLTEHKKNYPQVCKTP